MVIMMMIGMMMFFLFVLMLYVPVGDDWDDLFACFLQETIFTTSSDHWLEDSMSANQLSE